MPLVKVIRKGITPAVRKVPTSTCAVVMPMTADRIEREVGSENEEPTKVEDVNDAFAKFQPKLDFRAHAGAEETEFRAELRFRSLKDFDPENLQKRQEVKTADGRTEYLRNDLADLKNEIDLLYRLKDRWNLPTVRRAWNNESQREEIINALGRLREELQKVAQKGDKR
ncbi:MAG TPA: type VI secretion system contractile sheath small subunit [Bryobacteraceae bacterium]|jgi:predicted component of type VI protein secretion system|nr:type VI secretion system contractile sheath small subunit [Bryobacteraceae bacterium]